MILPNSLRISTFPHFSDVIAGLKELRDEGEIVVSGNYDLEDLLKVFPFDRVKLPQNVNIDIKTTADAQVYHLFFCVMDDHDFGGNLIKEGYVPSRFHGNVIGDVPEGRVIE